MPSLAWSSTDGELAQSFPESKSTDAHDSDDSEEYPDIFSRSTSAPLPSIGDHRTLTIDSLLTTQLGSSLNRDSLDRPSSIPESQSITLGSHSLQPGHQDLQYSWTFSHPGSSIPDDEDEFPRTHLPLDPESSSSKTDSDIPRSVFSPTESGAGSWTSRSSSTSPHTRSSSSNNPSDRGTYSIISKPDGKSFDNEDSAESASASSTRTCEGSDWSNKESKSVDGGWWGKATASVSGWFGSTFSGRPSNTSSNETEEGALESYPADDSSPSTPGEVSERPASPTFREPPSVGGSLLPLDTLVGATDHSAPGSWSPRPGKKHRASHRPISLESRNPYVPSTTFPAAVSDLSDDPGSH